MDDFSDFIAVLNDSVFEEFPVDVRTFVTGREYLNHLPLSEIQYEVVEAMSQIYRLEDLYEFMNRADARRHYEKYTKNEIILKLGKGSGKDLTSTIACAYIVYKLLCLKDPALYFGKPSGDAIDIINVAINAQQAKNVFFKGFKNKIVKSPWFRGKYSSPKVESIEFSKSITVYSGHSERESHEGLNILLAVLDEISGFASESPVNSERNKTADAIYNAFKGTVDSRFPDLGKIVLLSFPRYDDCFISRRYNDVVAEVEKVQKSHTFVIDEFKPADDPDNQFELTWEEDRIVSYKVPKTFALCRPTWDVNPTRKIDDFKIAFMTNEADARGRFLAQPDTVSDAFFGRKDKILSAMTIFNPLDEHNMPMGSFVPKPGVKYFMHADLAQKVDRCAVAISHVDRWVGIEYSSGFQTVQPYVVCDAIAHWKPGDNRPVDLKEVKDWIIRVRSLGFDIGYVSFDRWNSLDMQRDLTEVGFTCGTLSVAKSHYEDLMVILYEDRLAMPAIDVLEHEMKNLKVIKDKVDHPRKSGKDLSDALCGSVFNSVTLTPRNSDVVVEIHDITTEIKPSFNETKNLVHVSAYDDDEREFEVHII
jgi:hypothetical protein